MGFSHAAEVALFCLLSAVNIQAQADVQNPIRFEANSTSTCYNACSSLGNALAGKVEDGQLLPASFYGDYFSALQQETVPACVVFPASAHDVSDAIKIINQHECFFAVKSGGHAMFSGASSAPGGITIDLRYLRDLKISEDLETVSVGTGNRWGSVYEFLDPMNKTVVGGRDSQVGVGGFLLGGGISFISRRYGWGLDNVRNYEVVLANGSISEISHSTNPELYWALRGGGNNFGVVTRFDLETHPQSLMYGGFSVILLSGMSEKLSSLGISRTFSFTSGWLIEQTANAVNRVACLLGYCTTIDAFMDIYEKFSMAVEWDSDLYAQAYGYLLMVPYAHIYIVGSQLNHGGALTNAPAYGDFGDLTYKKAIYSTNRVSNASDFPKEITGLNPKGQRMQYEAVAFKVNATFLKAAANIFMSEFDPLRNDINGLSGCQLMQLITKDEISHFSKNGGNALGIEENDGPLLLLSTVWGWANKADDEAVVIMGKRVIEKWVTLGKEMGVYHPYIYQNYAAKHQDVFAGYGPENRARLRKIQKKYDPKGTFSRLQPGYFKV